MADLLEVTGGEISQKSVRVPDELWNAIKEESSRKGLTINAMVLTILWSYVEKINEARKP